MILAYPSRILLTCIQVWAAGAAFGQAPIKKTIWQQVNNGEEFMISLPEGYTTLGDQDFTSNGVRVEKRINVFRFVNGALLMVEVYWGDLRRLEETQIKNLTTGDKPFAVTRDETAGAFTAKELRLQRDKFFEIQQFYRSKKNLYIIKTLAPTEQDPIAADFLRSVRLGSGSAMTAPNGTGDPTIIHEAALVADETPLPDKPDREVIMILKPRPRYPEEARSSNQSGKVELKVLFSASGTVKEVIPVSGPKELWKASAFAANQIRFVPAVKDGKLVSTWKLISYTFSIY